MASKGLYIAMFAILLVFTNAADDDDNCSDHNPNCGDKTNWMEDDCGVQRVMDQCPLMCGQCQDFVTRPETTQEPPTTPEPDDGSCGGCEKDDVVQRACSRQVRQARRIRINGRFTFETIEAEQRYCCPPFTKCGEECLRSSAVEKAKKNDCGGCTGANDLQEPCTRRVMREVSCRGRGRAGRTCSRRVRENYCCDGFRLACNVCIRE